MTHVLLSIFILLIQFLLSYKRNNYLHLVQAGDVSTSTLMLNAFGRKYFLLCPNDTKKKTTNKKYGIYEVGVKASIKL